MPDINDMMATFYRRRTGGNGPLEDLQYLYFSGAVTSDQVATTFNNDGTIDQDFAAEDQQVTTTFNNDGSITQAYSGAQEFTRTTVFSADGSITQTIS